MIVTVRLLGPFARYSSRADIQLQVRQGTTVGEVLRVLAEHVEAEFQPDVLDQIEQLSSLVLINGNGLGDGRWAAELREGDTVALVPPMGGG